MSQTLLLGLLPGASLSSNPNAESSRFRELRLEALLDSPIAFTADYQKYLNQPPKFWEELLTFQPDASTIFMVEHEGKLLGMSGIARGSLPMGRNRRRFFRKEIFTMNI